MTESRKLIYALIAYACATSIAAGQQSNSSLDIVMEHPTRHGNVVVDVDDQDAQQKYHIALTKEGWIAALEHPRSDVRSYAANKLASAGYKDAVPAILAALKIEIMSGAQSALAVAAAQLGDERGVIALKEMCQDPGARPLSRMSAAQTMVAILKREDCFGDVLDVLRTRTDDQATVQALYLISRFRQLTPGQVSEVRALLTAAMESQSSSVRNATSSTLRQIGDSWAVDQLRNAIRIEQDDTVRSIMARNLAFLEHR